MKESPIITVKNKCGCKVTSSRYGDRLYYCPLHKSAPMLYEALKALTFQFAAAVEHPYSADTRVYTQAREALSNAEGG